MVVPPSLEAGVDRALARVEFLRALASHTTLFDELFDVADTSAEATAAARRLRDKSGSQADYVRSKFEKLDYVDERYAPDRLNAAVSWTSESRIHPRIG